MDERELVNEVIRELKKRLNQEDASEHISVQDKTEQNISRKRVLVLGNLTLREAEALSGCKLAEADGWNSYDIVLAAQMSLDTMAQVALGNPQNKESTCLLKSLLEGKQVFALMRGLEYRLFRDKAVKTLYRLYQEYEDRIRQYGIRIIGDIGEIREQAEVLGGNTQAGYLDLTGIKVITETNFSKMRSGGSGRVLIDRNAVITPLAKDYAANHRLQLERQ